MDNEKIKQFIQLRRQAGDNDATIAAFLKSKNVQLTPDLFGAKPKLKTGLSGVAQTLGESTALQTKDYQDYQKSNIALGDMNLKLLQTIRENKKQGKDTSRLEHQYKVNTGNEVEFEDIAPSAQKTNKALAGDLLQTAGYLATPLGTSSMAGRIGIGTTMGALSGTGSAMSKNESSEDILAAGLKGATIGAVISGTLEMVGAGLRGISKSRVTKNFTANTYNKELQPKANDIAKQIEKTPVGQAFKTFGVEVRDAVDDAGKPLYTGTYRTILDKAKTTVSSKGDQLNKVLSKYDDVAINKNEVAGDIVSTMQDRMGRLSKNELEIIKKEVGRITENTITPTQALNYKRLYDSKIPDSFWNDTADRTKAIAVQSRYILRDNLRTLIIDKTGDEAVRSLSLGMKTAMEVRRLAASQIAQRAVGKIGAEGSGSFSVWRAIYGLIDDTIFNPALTTRTAQKLNTMGQKTGQTLPRKLLRSSVIQGSSKD